MCETLCNTPARSDQPAYRVDISRIPEDKQGVERKEKQIKGLRSPKEHQQVADPSILFPFDILASGRAVPQQMFDLESCIAEECSCC